MFGSLMDMVLTTVGIIIAMLLLTCFGCLLMKLSDLKLKRYIVKTAQRKGINVDPEKLTPKYRAASPSTNETCLIMVSDVVIVM